MSDSRTKNTAKNMGVGFLYQLFSLILSFVSRTVFIYVLGSEYLGLNGIFSDVLSLLSMADLGFGTAMAYSFYKPLADKDEEAITALISFYKKIYNIIALVVAVLGACCIPFLRFIVRTEQEIPNLEIYYVFSLASVVISYLFVYKTTLLTADQKDYKVVVVRIWTTLLRTVLQIVVLLVFKGYLIYIAIGVICQFVNNLVSTLITEKEYPYIKNKNLTKKIDKSVSDGIFANMKSVFIYKASTTLFSATDNVIISIVVGTALVGVYSNYLLVSSKLLLIEQIIFSAMVASIGNVIAKESAEKRLKIFNAMQSVSFIFCGIITSAFCILANDLVKVWLGGSYTLSFLTIIAITLNTYMSCALQPLWIYRDAAGLYIKTKYIMLFGAILNIGLSFGLGYIIGLPGIIFASAIARILSYVWYEPKILYSEYFGSKVNKYYLSLLKNILIVAVTILVLSQTIGKIEATSWGILIIKGMIVGVICSVVFLLAYCKSEGFVLVKNKFLSFIKK